MDLNDHPDPKQRWFHRRVQSYLALIGIICLPVVAVFTNHEALGRVADAVTWPLGLIVLGYHGCSAWESININRSSK